MFQKRNIVLAALILALGTAVYINWQYTAGEGALSAGASAGENNAQLGDVLYVNGEAVSAPSSDTSSGNTTSATESNTSSESAGDSAYFSEAVLSRQRARDEAVELLKEILKAAEKSEAAKKEAVAQAARLAEAIAREAKIESLLKAKGYESCLAFLEEEKANVIIGTVEGLLPHETITIKDIVHNQSGLPFADIIIVEVK